MKKGLVTIFVIVAIVIVAGILIFTNFGGSDVNSDNNNNGGSGSGNSAGPQTFTVTITDDGYSPQSLTISSGDTVTWKNDGSQENWPASAIHPTHRVYPDSDIVKCGTAEEDNIFDACRGLANEDEWSFTFDEAGSWGYHDHLHANLRGTIVVQ